MKNSLRVVYRTVLILALLVGIALIAVMFKGSEMIRKAVEVAGPKVMGVPVTLGGVSFRPIRGRITLTGLRIGNPEGFKSPSMFDLARVDVEVDPGSLLSDTIVIRKIDIEKPQITYEVALGKTNVGKLLDQIEERTGGKAPSEGESKPDAKPAPAEPSPEPEKKVVIDEFLLSGGEITVAATVLQGHGATVHLKDIQMRDIGREGGEGASVSKVLVFVLGTVLKSVVEAVKDSGQLVGDGVKALGDAAQGLGKQIGNFVPGADEAISNKAAKALNKLGKFLGQAQEEGKKAEEKK